MYENVWPWVNVVTSSLTTALLLWFTVRRLRQSRESAVLVQPAAPIEVMAIYTGGHLYTYPEGQREAAALLFSELAAQLTALHAFAFTSPIRDGQPHELRVVPTRPGYRARAPQAFVAPPG